MFLQPSPIFISTPYWRVERKIKREREREGERKREREKERELTIRTTLDYTPE
jgi:hypothetical protein